MKKEREQKKAKAASPKPKRPKTTVEEDHEKPYDFWGLPQRDLKKNLGCG